MIASLYENLPFIIFLIALAINLVVFVVGVIMSLTAKDPIKLEKGKKVLAESGLIFATILLIVVVFSSVTWILNKTVTEEPIADLNGYPASPFNPNVPQKPLVINVSGAYFNGPYHFSISSVLNRAAVFLILCQTNDNYDIIDIEFTRQGEDLTAHKDYQCWLDTCQNYANLNVGLLLLPVRPTQDELEAGNILVDLIRADNKSTCDLEVEREDSF